MTNRNLSRVGLFLSLCLAATANAAELTRVDLAKYDPAGDVRVERQGDSLRATWPIDSTQFGTLELDLRPDQPLIRSLDIRAGDGQLRAILAGVDPGVVVTVGTRDLSRQGWMVFFDKVNTRPYESFGMTLARESASVITERGRVTITLDGAKAGPFAGEFRFTLYPGSALVQAEAVMQTDRPATAFLFDSGLVARDGTSPFKRIVYTNPDRHAVEVLPTEMQRDAIRVPVRNRIIGAEGADGGYAFIVPTPHQYFYPLDFCDNFQTAWVGRNYREHLGGTGFGVCQSLDGDRRYVPWVNAPQGTRQEMGVFYLLSAGDREAAESHALSYTRDDKFKPVDGYKTFTSHYHVEMTIERLREIERRKKQGEADRHARPEFVDVFREMGIDIAHLAEFHLGDGDLKIAPRIDRLKLMHEECARWSDDQLLLLPGEEPNVHLGGHWISFFPKPVYWTLDRTEGQPFVEEDPMLGKVYHVGSSDDVLKLMEAEKGLMWTAHPRIKGSIGFPDVYKSSAYFQSPHFLGGAWKAMPADYSVPKLGTRVIDLLDDMSNWGANKQILGEVDVFAIDNHSELYAHMNVNYIKLDALPRFVDGWHGVLDVLRQGRYFTTTGEVLIPSFTIDGKSSGEALAEMSADSKVRATVEWTFPLDYAEIVSGDGANIFRERIDLRDTRPFGKRDLDLPVDLRGRSWARLEVWDIARNGAFTQPIRLNR
jgi:hypothetical protein